MNRSSTRAQFLSMIPAGIHTALLTAALVALLAVSFADAAPTKKSASRPNASRRSANEPRKATHDEKQAFEELLDVQAKEAKVCYHADVARSKRKNLRGLVSIRFVVNPAGRVVEAGPIHNTTRSRYLADCLVRLVEKVRFAARSGGNVIGTHAFRFPPEFP